MKYILGILLVLFASYADIFLFRVGIIPFEPSQFVLPLFIVIGFIKYSIIDLRDVVRSHSFKLFAVILFSSLVYTAITPVPTSLAITKISLDAITLFLYVIAVHFFRTEDRKLVFLVVFMGFVTLAGSVWYDFFIGLPKYTEHLETAVRKGGFGENPNKASSGIKFLALGVLVFLSKFKLKKILFIFLMVISVFLTLSRSGMVSIILILIIGIANNWNTKFEITIPSLFKSGFRMVLVFGSLYAGLFLLSGVIKSNFPQFTRGAAGQRIDLLLGKTEKNVISEDVGTGGGRGDLLIMYFDRFLSKPFGHGTAYTSDSRYNPLNTHNYYLFLGVNYGIILFVIYLLYLFKGFTLSISHDKFYYVIFIALLFFEGFVSHSIYYERALLVSLAFFDSLIYANNKTESNSVLSNES